MPRGKKKSTRKNVTTACLECKKSKTKCTGNTPCGNCTKRVMNRCKACKNNIKDIDISKLEACGKCQTQASKSCEFPQEKPRRGPPPRKTNQKAINCITINRIDNSDNNNNSNNNIISNNDNNVLVSPYESSSATFSPNSNFSPFLPPLSLSFPFPSPPPDTPFDIKDKNIFGEGVLFDYTKETINIDSVNDDSLFSEFIIFEESISDDNNNDDIDNNNNGDDNNNGGNNKKEEDDKLSSTTTISTSTIPTATMQIPTETAIIPGVATEDNNNNNYYYYCDQQLPHDPDYIYIFQPHDYTLYGHLPRTEMDLLLGLSQAPPSIIAPLEGQYTAGTQ